PGLELVRADGAWVLVVEHGFERRVLRDPRHPRETLLVAGHEPDPVLRCDPAHARIANPNLDRLAPGGDEAQVLLVDRHGAGTRRTRWTGIAGRAIPGAHRPLVFSVRTCSTSSRPSARAGKRRVT